MIGLALEMSASLFDSLFVLDGLSVRFNLAFHEDGTSFTRRAVEVISFINSVVCSSMVQTEQDDLR